MTDQVFSGDTRVLQPGAQRPDVAPAADVPPSSGSAADAAAMAQNDSDASGQVAAARTAASTSPLQDQRVAILLADSHWSEQPLLTLSSELLAIYASLPLYGGHNNVPELRQYLVQHLTRLRQQGILADYSPRQMDKACYLLAASLDEGILATDWGRLSGWENHTLLSQLYQQRNGGEVFFTILDQLQQRPDTEYDLIALSYLLLRLGFEGKYRHSDGHELAELSQSLYELLGHNREQPIATSPQLPTQQAYRPLRMLRLGRYLLLTLATAALGYGMTWAWTHGLEQRESPALQRTLEFTAPPPPLKKGTVYISTPQEMQSEGAQ